MHNVSLLTHNWSNWWHQGGSFAGCDPAVLSPEERLYVQPGLGHVESIESKRRIVDLIKACGLYDEVHVNKDSDIEPASDEHILSVHTEHYLGALKRLDQTGGDAGDFAFMGQSTLSIARISSALALAGVDSILSGRNAYAMTRPPGHHATRNEGMGFCVLNNVSIAAKYALKRGCRKVAIVDYDVHHGNGTQDIFYDDPNVFVISLHQDNLYPLNSGSALESGSGAGHMYNVNIPLPPGSGRGAYCDAFDRIVDPLISAFDPDVILVSSGFDASAFDPLGCMMLSSSAFHTLAKKILSHQKPTLFVHEGGYSPVSSPYCGLRVLEALCGISTSDSRVIDPSDDEVESYGGQTLQPHQAALIDELVRTLVDPFLAKHPSHTTKPVI